MFIYLHQLYHCPAACLLVLSKNERENKSKRLQREIQSASQGDGTSMNEFKNIRDEQPVYHRNRFKASYLKT